MVRRLILGQLDPDLACAIALGLVECPHVTVNLHAITIHDNAMRPVGTVRDWLDPADPLDAATRDYLTARAEANKTTAGPRGQHGWVAAAAVKTRELANSRAQQARELARGFLAQRGVLAAARKAGWRVLGVD